MSLRFPLFLLIAAVLLAACGGNAVAPTVTPAGGLPPLPTSVIEATVIFPTVVNPNGQPQPGAVKQWPEPPAMSIDPAKIYLATFETEKGEFQVQLFADKAPLTVNNFVFLARQGYYDNTTFHRVLADFMAQGGDPTGTGGGGPGYQFADEFHPDLAFDSEGILAMANAGPGTTGSQFFVTFAPTAWLNGKHTIFGKVVQGMDVAKSLKLRDPGANPDFSGDVLQTITIEEIPASLLPPPTAPPVPVPPVLAQGRPLAKLEVAARENLYTGKPARGIDLKKTYIATLKTSKGEITVELYPQDAPESVNILQTG